MWNRLCFIRFLQVSQIFQRRKSDANKQDFENKLNLTGHAQSTPKTTGILNKVFSTSGPNLVALAWTGDELSRGQAQNGVNFDFEVKFDLEGQDQLPPKTIGILTKVFYTYAPNCGKDYKYFLPHCCKCNSFGCIAEIISGNARHGPHSDNVYSGSEHR